MRWNFAWDKRIKPVAWNWIVLDICTHICMIAVKCGQMFSCFHCFKAMMKNTKRTWDANITGSSSKSSIHATQVADEQKKMRNFMKKKKLLFREQRWRQWECDTFLIALFLWIRLISIVSNRLCFFDILIMRIIIRVWFSDDIQTERKRESEREWKKAPWREFRWKWLYYDNSMVVLAYECKLKSNSSNWIKLFLLVGCIFK